MPVETPSISINPYTSTVPLVQVPIGQQDAATRPAPPLAGQFGRKSTGPLAIGDAIVKGLLMGHAEKEQRKNAQAQATIAAADSSTEAAYQKYQDALSQSGGKADDPNTKAAYDAYLGVFNQAKEAKAKFVIPEQPKKGAGKAADGKKGEKSKFPGFGNIKEFMAANPHIIPQIAIMTMQPKPPGQSRETKLQDLQTQAAQTQVDLGKTELEGAKAQNQRGAEQDAEKKRTQAVEAAGGIDAVLADKKADPQLKQQATQMKFAALDAQSPEGKAKAQLLTQMQDGTYKQWTPEQRMLAGTLGVAPPLQQTEVQGKNGHKQQVLIDPLTNQPVPGSKPLDLGPPAWAQEFYAKRGADRADLKKAVAADPTAYNVPVTGNPQADKAAIDARVEQLFVKSEMGIQSLSDTLGRTGYEVQRDNTILTDVVKAAGLNAKQSRLDTGQETMDYGDGKKFAVGREYFNKILDKFTTQQSGVRAFRDQPQNPDNNPPNVMEAERKFLYGWVKNQMMEQKGKNALTSEQADKLLSQTSLGKPITSQGGKMERPTQAEGGGQPAQASGGIQRPSSEGSTPQNQMATDSAGNIYRFDGQQWVNVKTLEPYSGQ